MLYSYAISKASLPLPASLMLTFNPLQFASDFVKVVRITLHLKDYVIGIKRHEGGRVGAKVIKGAEKRESTITHNAIYT